MVLYKCKRYAQRPKQMYETLKEARYTYGEQNATGEHTLYNQDSDIFEIWACNKFHAGYALKFKNTHLEFCRSIRKDSEYDLYLRNQLKGKLNETLSINN